MKVIQIAIERGEDISGNAITALWALTDDGQIFVRVKGKWTKVDGPPERRKREPTGIE